MSRPLKTTTGASTFTPSFGWAAYRPTGRASCHPAATLREATRYGSEPSFHYLSAPAARSCRTYPFFASLSGRVLCRRQPKKRPNSGVSGVDRKPTNEPNSPTWGRAHCRTQTCKRALLFDPPPNDPGG
ncbi:hypothetical protein [Spirosoma daeguense]